MIAKICVRLVREAQFIHSAVKSGAYDSKNMRSASEGGSIYS